MFPLGKSGQEIWGFEISRVPGSLYRDPGKCFSISKDFSGTDNFHSDTKNALVLRYCKSKFCFAYTKLLIKIRKTFQNSFQNYKN